MRKMLLMSAALLGVAFGPAVAQNSTSSTMSPPAPNAAVGSPNTSNSIPSGAGTATRNLPGSEVGTTGVGPGTAMPAAGMGQPDRGMSGMRPMRGQQGQGMGPAQEGGMMPRGHRMDGHHGMRGADGSRSGEYRGGAGSPMSHSASNTGASNTRSEMAPRLPDPGSADNSAQSYLAAAQRALAANRTGAAQEALERAETRLLSRSTEASMAGSPATMPAVQQIGQARRALAARDMAGARSAVNAAIASGG